MKGRSIRPGHAQNMAAQIRRVEGINERKEGSKPAIANMLQDRTGEKEVGIIFISSMAERTDRVPRLARCSMKDRGVFIQTRAVKEQANRPRGQRVQYFVCVCVCVSGNTKFCI